MKVFINIVICCLIIKANSQNDFWQRNVQANYGSVVNPDQIYFADNRPFGTNNIQRETVNSFLGTTPVTTNIGPGQFTPYQNNVVIQQSVETANNEAGLVQQVKPVTNKNELFQAEAVTPTIDNTEYAVTNFGLNLLKKISSSMLGNMVISPFSITSALALLQRGATGSSQDQISAALQLDASKSGGVFRLITEDLKRRKSQNIFKSVNNMFAAETFTVNPTFERVAKRNFGSDVTLMQFNQPEVAVKRINNWVAAMTNGKIENLFARDAISEDTQLVLVNAVYFKGLWKFPFNTKLTTSQPFQLSGGKQKSAQFMKVKEYFRTGVDPVNNATVISLPFENHEYSLLIVMPHEHSNVNDMISSLTVEQLMTYQKFKAMDVMLQLPKFTVKADTALEPVLRKLGITNIFSNRAELTGIGTFRDSSPQISSAVHSAVLTIDEQGGTAAAASGFGAVALSFDFPTEVKINRPFLAIIWDNISNIPMFMAKIEDPVA